MAKRHINLCRLATRPHPYYEWDIDGGRKIYDKELGANLVFLA